MTRSQAVVFAALVGRYLLGAIFLVAGAAKLTDGRRFARTVAAYEVLPRAFVPMVARWLPPAELLAGVLLCLNLQTRLVSALVGVALVTFAGVGAFALLHGRKVDCGCFGATARTRLSWTHIAGNVLLALDALYQAAVTPDNAANLRSPTVPAIILATLTLCLLLMTPDAVKTARWLTVQGRREGRA